MLKETGDPRVVGGGNSLTSTRIWAEHLSIPIMWPRRRVGRVPSMNNNPHRHISSCYLGEERSVGKKDKAKNTSQGSTGRFPTLLTGQPDLKVPSKGISRREYNRRLADLHIELVKLQHWIVHRKMKVVIIFEGRDAAGKGGTIKRITECLNPRVCRVVALPAPTEREQTQWYFQRYVAHLPAAGEMVIFDRSWYNRAGVERVMDYCTQEQYQEFLRSCPEFERMLDRSRHRADQVLVLRR